MKIDSDEIRLEMRIRNNRLYQLIFESYPSVAAFCKDHQLHQSEVGEYLNLKKSPLKRNGQYKPTPIRISNIFRLLPEDVFPVEIYTVEKTEIATSLATSEVRLDMLRSKPSLINVEDQFLFDSLKTQIESGLTTLPRREAYVIKRRLGMDGQPRSTLEEIATDLGVIRERIRQIELKGYHRLRKAKGINRLREYFDLV